MHCSTPNVQEGESVAEGHSELTLKLYCNFLSGTGTTDTRKCLWGGLGPWVRAKCGWRIVELSVAFQTWILNYFVNASRGWMMTRNMVTNSFTIV